MKLIQPIQYFAAALLLLAAYIAPVAAQNFTIPQFAIGGGGGVSRDSMFSVASTIGQPVSGESADSRFTLWSGFLPMSSTRCVFTGIRLEPLGNGQVRVSWPLPECGYVLYHTTTFRDWAPLPSPFQVNSNHLSVIRSEPAEFFFLRRP